MNIAIGVFNPFDSTSIQTIDPAFGRIKFSLDKWGQNEEGIFQNDVIELESFKCSA